MRKYLFIAVLIWLACAVPAALAADYYVDATGGNDEAAGTSTETAWKTVAQVNDFAASPGFQNGDTINFKRGEVWSNDETLGRDGAGYINWGAINGLTIQDYGTGDLPWLNGNTQRPVFIYDYDTSAGGLVNVTIKNLDVSGGDWWDEGWFDGNLRMTYCANVVFDNIYFDGHKGATDNGPVGALYIGVPHGNLEIKNCEIKNAIGIGGTLGEWGAIDAHGACIIWTETANPPGPKSSGTVSIHDNVMHDVEADCIQLMGIRCSTDIYRNKMYNFGENALDFKSSYGTTIYNNEFYRGDYGVGGTGGGLGNIVFHNLNSLTCSNAVIRDNYFHTTDYIGLRLIDAIDFKIYRNRFDDCTCGIQMHTNTNVSVYNNVFDLASGVTGGTPVDAGIYVTSSYQNGSKIFNNAFYLGGDHRYGLLVYKSGVEIKNNIVHMTRADSWPLYVSYSANPTVSHNCYYNPSDTERVSWNGTAYSSSQQADFRTDHDPAALFSDHGINVPTAFYPDSAADAAVNGGTSYGTEDANPGLRYDSVWGDPDTTNIVTLPRSGGIDLGPYEFYQTTFTNVFKSDPAWVEVWLLNNNGSGGLDLAGEFGNTLTNNNATLNTSGSPEGDGWADFLVSNSAYLTIASSSDLILHTGATNKAFTVGGWFMFDDDAGTEALIAKYNSGANARSFYLGRNIDEYASVYLGYEGGTLYRNPLHASVLAPATPYLIAASFDGTSSCAIRIRDTDGDVVGTDAVETVDLGASGLTLNAEPWYIGANNGTANFDGNADMVFMADRVLTADEITKIAQGKFKILRHKNRCFMIF